MFGMKSYMMYDSIISLTVHTIFCAYVWCRLGQHHTEVVHLLKTVHYLPLLFVSTNG